MLSQSNRHFLKLPKQITATYFNNFSCIAFRQERPIREAMERENINYGKKLNQLSNQTFNASKDTEAIKH
jgi:hypothetical protein